jgi:hypothetical protein
MLQAQFYLIINSFRGRLTAAMLIFVRLFNEKIRQNAAFPAL